ncbi:MAG TPA: 50S ribosomal protein L13 [Burkholderiales bacterium]|nr:50S ribosomal protein L13 [Burkholderiales bacterium]
MKTFTAKAETIKRDWYLVDAQDKVLGRLASQLALRLRGKHKPEFTPHVDTGDYIVVVNADKLRVTGNKATDKLYHRHTTYPGGLRTTNFTKLLAKHPRRVLEIAVKGMLPKGPLGYAMLKKLKVYAGTAHPHSAQQPKPLDIK